MGGLFRYLMKLPIFRPLTRFLIGALAIPLFRFFLKRVVRLQEMDEELEKDLEQWFSCSLVLLASTSFMEPLLFGWLIGDGTPDGMGNGSGGMVLGNEINPWLAGMRIFLAIGVIEAMPDQELFAIVHPGPPKLKYDRKRRLRDQIQVRKNTWPYLRGMLCQHINRSSPVFAILAAIIPGIAGVICFLMAITQYLIIGLVTSRDKALNVLGEFDKQVAIRRREIIEEFQLDDKTTQDKSASSTLIGPHRAAESSTTLVQPVVEEGGIVAKADEAGYETG